MGLLAGRAGAVLDGGGAPDPGFASLHAWYDAGTGVNAPGGAADGDPVTSWQDRSDNARHIQLAGPAGARPHWDATAAGGLPGLRFDGSDWLDGGAAFGSVPGDRTLFVVLRLRAADGAHVLASSGAGWPGIETGRFFPPITGAIGWLANTDGVALGGPAPELDVFQVYSLVQSATAGAHYVNGQLLDAGSGSTEPLDGLVLGSNAARTLRMNGDVAELLVYSQALPDPDRQAVEGYLRSRYPAEAQAPDPPFVDLWGQGIGGYQGYRIPALQATKQGSLLAFAEARNSITDDIAANDIVMRRSTDRGATWSRQVLLHEEGDDSLNDPLVVQVEWGPREGRVLLFFDHISATQPTRVLKMHSDDDGLTWVGPVDVTPQVAAPGGGGAVPGTGLQKQGAPHAGRIIMPMSGAVGAYAAYSDDGGDTWTAGAGAQPGNENQMVELEDGRLLVSIRAEGARMHATSTDAGESFTASALEPGLIQPAAGVMTSLFRLSDRRAGFGVGRLLFSTPDSTNFRAAGRIFVSRDEAATWSRSRLVYSGKFGYSSMAVLDDQSLGILYERSNRDAFTIDVERLSFARVTLSDLTGGAECFGDWRDPGACLACNDGEDNDSDGLVDYPDDPECSGFGARTEQPAHCGLGVEAALFLLVPAALRTRRNRRSRDARSR